MTFDSPPTPPGGPRPPAKATPDVWLHLRAVWEQIDWWAAALIFVLASILAPRLLAGASAADFALLGIVIVASFLARAAIVFGLIPVLAAEAARHVLRHALDPRELHRGGGGLAITVEAGEPAAVAEASIAAEA